MAKKKATKQEKQPEVVVQVTDNSDDGEHAALISALIMTVLRYEYGFKNRVMYRSGSGRSGTRIALAEASKTLMTRLGTLRKKKGQVRIECLLNGVADAKGSASSNQD